MKPFWRRWSWKGFFIRYLIILAILLAVNVLFTDTGVNNFNPHTQPSMKISHELVGSDLHLTFKLKDFKLSLENMNKSKKWGEGHIHLYIDGQKKMKIFEEHYVWKGLEPGTHQIRLELAHNDHDPYGVEQSLTVTVEES